MKKQLKTITTILLFGGFIFFGYSSGEESDIHAATSLEEAKEEVDDLVSTYQDEYNELCQGPRNDQAKDNFLELSKKIRSLESCGSGCEKLDYDVQTQVNHYAFEKVNNNSGFEKLIDEGSIECW